MAKRKKPRYYVAQVGGSNFNWSIPEDKSPSVVNQTATGATDIYGNTYFKQDNTGAPTFDGPVTGDNSNKKSLWDLFANTNKTELHPAIQGLNAGMQTVTGVANMINEVNNKKYEKDQYLRAITPDYYENMEGYGLNANPVFTKYGGSTKYQVGGRPTTKDSLDLYNNALALKEYYNSQNYRVDNIKKADNRRTFYELDHAKDDMQWRLERQQRKPDTNRGQNDNIDLTEYHKDIDKNRFLQREIYDYILDLRSPMTLYDRRINPQFETIYKNQKQGDKLIGDAVGVYEYDPIAVKPWNMLTPKEKEIRARKYGTPEQKAEVLGDKPLPYPNINFKPSEVKGVDMTDVNVQGSGYKPSDLSQKPTKYSASYRDESAPNKQKTIYFKDKKAWQNFVDSNALFNTDTREDAESASATGYRTMQMGGQQIATVNPKNPTDPTDAYYSANATLAYYKDKLNSKLKAKNPQGFQDYFKGLVDLRRTGNQTGAADYIQNTAYNDFLTPDEVKTTLGDDDYNRYISSLQAVNNYNVSQGKQSLWGTEEGQNDINELNYGRRFASLVVTPSLSHTNKTRGTTYNRSYTYNPQTQSVDISETGDLSIRPSNFTNPSPNRMQTGGVPRTYGLQKGGKAFANVEAEQGEAFQTNDGQIAQVANDANTHEEGGVFLPNVHRVLENTSNIRKDRASQILKLTPEDVKHATGAEVKGNMSHAEALVKANDYFEEKRNKITKKIELAAKDRQDLDKYGELSTKLNMEQFAAMPTKAQLFEQLFNNQEMLKAMNNIPTGGEAKYGGGLDRSEDYGNKSKPYPSVNSGDFAGGGRSYPIPTRADAEDALRLAHLHGRSDVISKVYEKYPDLKKQYGGEAKKMQLAGYAGSKTGMKTPKGNPDSFSGSFDEYLQDLKAKGFNYEGITSNADLQTALYDYKLQNKQFDDIKNMWGEGMHQKGMAEARKLGFVDEKGMFKPGVLDDPKNLEALAKLYPDGLLGPRTLRVNKGKTPPRIWSDDDIPTPDTPTTPEQILDPSITTPNIYQQARSRFNEPLRWYDVASPVNAYIAALEREPGKYNPMEFNQLRYKLQDPTAALQQNQADYNAAVDATQSLAPNNPGAAAANVANLAAGKYAANNQILGQYENQNAQIKNNEITYNTQVRDKNSLADQQAREVFEGKVLTSKAIQQEQKLTALDSLYKTIAENRALNRNGNLIMKFSRAFDQYGDYNGYQPIFQVSPTFGVQTQTGTNTSTTQAGGGLQQIKAGKDYYNRRSGKTYYFDGNKLLQRK